MNEYRTEFLILVHCCFCFLFCFFFSAFVSAFKGRREDAYFHPEDGSQFVPDNYFPLKANIIANVERVKPGDRLYRMNGQAWRKSENSIEEVH